MSGSATSYDLAIAKQFYFHDFILCLLWNRGGYHWVMGESDEKEKWKELWPARSTLTNENSDVMLLLFL